MIVTTSEAIDVSITLLLPLHFPLEICPLFTAQSDTSYQAIDYRVLPPKKSTSHQIPFMQSLWILVIHRRCRHSLDVDTNLLDKPGYLEPFLLYPEINHLIATSVLSGILQVESVQWTFDNINSEEDQSDLTRLADFLASKEFDMVINLPMRGSGARR